MKHQHSDTGDRGGADPGAKPPAAPRSPLKLLGAAFRGARRLSRRSREVAADLARRGAHRVEARALGVLKRKLDEVGGDATATAAASTAVHRAASPAAANTGDVADPAQLLSQMLQVAMEQSQEQARRELYLSVLRQLLPDEVRLLSAMADGSSYAMCHLGAGPTVGPATHRLLENLSVIGRAAGVRLLDATPHYVTHLRDMGLVESGPEDPKLKTKYEMLETDTALRQAVEHIEKVLKLKPRFFRRTIRISDFGKQLWAACHSA